MSIGVIIGIELGPSEETLAKTRETLRARFPGVEIAIVSGAVGMVSFEYIEPARGYPLR